MKTKATCIMVTFRLAAALGVGRMLAVVVDEGVFRKRSVDCLAIGARRDRAVVRHWQCGDVLGDAARRGILEN